MRFTRLKLENWRNFRAVDVSLAQRVFVVGPNASGKSNLLDAIRFLRDIADRAGGLRRAIDERRGMRSIRSLYAPVDEPAGITRAHSPLVSSAAPVLVEVQAEIEGKPWRYSLALGSLNGEATVVWEEVDGPYGELLRRPDLDDQQDPELLTQTHLEQISANKPFRKLAELFASVEYTHIVPELVRQPRAPATHGGWRDPYGADLLESISALPEEERNRRLVLLQGQLAKVIPQLQELLYVPDERGRPHLGARFARWQSPGSFHLEDQLSDGTLRLLGLLWVLGAGASPLLLEEPELSLHAAAVRQIPQVLARVAAKTDRQILVSTHSEEMLSDTGIDPSEILILTPTDEDTQVSVGAEDPMLVALARDDAPLSGVLVAKTKPKDVEQLSYAFGGDDE
jgi:predicted ATPase